MSPLPSALPRLRRRWRIQPFLTATLVLFIVLVVGSITVFDGMRQRALFRRDLEEKGLLLTKALAEVLGDALYFTDVERARHLSELVRSMEGVGRYRVFTVDRRVLVDSATAKYGMGSVDEAALELALDRREPTLRQFEGELQVVGPILAGDRVLGGVVVGLDLGAVSPVVRQMILEHIWWGSMAMILGAFVAYLLARRMVAPVRRLTMAARRVAAGDMSFSADEHRRDEIGDLSNAFDEMVRQVASRAKAKSRQYTSQLESANELLRKHAMEDSLTRLPNRRLLLDRLAAETRRADREGNYVAILFIDLDRFKVINDSLGHAVGDGLLRQLARRLEKTTRRSDTVGRLGGDEFAILAPDLKKPESAGRIARQVVEAVREPFREQAQEFILTASIGISVYPDDGTDFEGLLRSADMAMRKAKELGRDNFQFYAREMGERAREQLDFESEIRGALADGQLESHYQPILDLASGRICAIESLLRWRHPRRGLLAADQFLPLLERTGRLDTVHRQILKEGSERLRGLHERLGVDLRLSINLSARHLQRHDLIPELSEILAEAALEPRFLELEITETAAMGNEKATLATLRELEELGVSISIDDFGAGYSSLSYLRYFPISKVKIDRQFVRDLPEDRDSVAIVEAVISLAHSLGIRVTAEGVETDEQLAFLESTGCDEIQGYWLHPALPPAELEESLQHSPSRLSASSRKASARR